MPSAGIAPGPARSGSKSSGVIKYVDPIAPRRRRAPMLTSYCAPPELAALLRRHEGVRASPYRDVEGNLTIGVGHNLDCVPLSARAIDLILDDDIQAVAQQVAGVVGDIVW